MKLFYLSEMITPDEALPDREEVMQVSPTHYVRKDRSIVGPFPENLKKAVFGMGCFWGAEKKFWWLKGVHSTAVGYSAGFSKNPVYKDVCTGRTGHGEVVLVVYDPEEVSYQQLLKVFWESHNPTQGMRQGGDYGTQYRSGIYTFSDEQEKEARESLEHYQAALDNAGFTMKITTEILPATEFYYAEDEHQQYLAKNPMGYCGSGGCGVDF